MKALKGLRLLIANSRTAFQGFRFLLESQPIFLKRLSCQVNAHGVSGRSRRAMISMSPSFGAYGASRKLYV